MPTPPGALTYAWSKVSGPGTVTFANSTAATTTANFSQAGTYVLGLTASDSLLAGTSNVTITVQPVNQPPVVNAGAKQTIQLPSSATLNGSATDDGYPNPPGVLTFAWNKVSGPGAVVFANATTAVTTASFSQPGIYVLSLTASDSLLTGSANVTVGVLPANKAPVVSAGRDRAVALPNSLMMGGTVSDDGLPAGAALTSVWSKVSGPGNATFANAADPATSVSFNTPGTYVLRLTASDTVLSSSTDSTIVVLPATNQPPHVNAGASHTIVIGMPASLNATATDDGLPNPPGTLTYSWSKASGPGVVNFSNASALSTIATFSATGVYTLRMTANDSLLSASGDVAITVIAGNQAPTVSAGNDQSIRLPQNSVTLNGVAFDDGLPSQPGALTISWIKVSGSGNVTFGDATKASTTAAFDQPGTYILRLTANDSVLSSSADVTVIVAQVNQAPVVHAGPDQTIRFTPAVSEQGPLQFTVLASASSIGNGFVGLFYDAPSSQVISCIDGRGKPTSFVSIHKSGSITPFGNLGNHTPSTVAFIPDDGNGKSIGGFDAGDIFFADGLITRYSVKTGQYTTLSIPTNYGIQLILDTSGAFGGDLLAIGNFGQVFRINSALEISFVAQVPNQREPDSTILVPNDPAYGIWAGKIVLTNEDNELLYLLDSSGQVSSYNIGTTPESIAFCLPNHDLYALRGDAGDGAANYVFTTPAASLAFMAGDLMAIDDRFGDVFRIHWDGTQMQTTFLWRGGVCNSLLFAPAGTAAGTSTITLAGSATDDGIPATPGKLTYLWSKVSGPGLVAFADATRPYTEATLSAGGDYVLRLTVDDGDLHSSSDVTIQANQAPVIKAGANTSVDVSKSITLNGTVRDDGLPNPPGTILSGWNKVLGPGNVTFSLPTYEAASDFKFNSNNAPWSYGWMTTNGSGFTPFDLSYANYFDGLDRLYSSTNNTGLFYNNTKALLILRSDHTYFEPADELLLYTDGTGKQAAVRWTAPADGTYLFSGRFHPILGASASPTIILNSTNTIFQQSGNNVSSVIQFDIPQAISAGDTVDFLPNTSDPLGAGNYQMGFTVAVTPMTASTSTTATFSLPGVYTLSFGATDTVLATRDFLTVSVTAGNQAPVVSAGPDLTVTMPANNITLNGSATDDGLPEIPGLTKYWSKISGPGTVTYIDQGSPVTQVTFSAAGTYVMRLTANDSLVESFDDMTVTVLEVPVNQVPVVNAGQDQAILYPNVAILSGTITDDGLPNPPGAVTATWAKVSGPGTVTFADATSASTTAAFGLPGTYVLKLTGSDTELTSASTVTIQTYPLNQPPVVSAGPGKTISLPTNTINLTGTVNDDGLPILPGAVTVLWTSVSGPGTVGFSAPNSISTGVSFGQAGTYVLRLTASDGLLSAASDVTVVVAPQGNTPPVISLLAAQTVRLPASAALGATITDDGLPNPPGVTTTSWSKVAGPGTVTFDNVNNTSTFSADGTYVLRLTASDSQLSTSADTTITVLPAHSVPVINLGPDITAQLSGGGLVFYINGTVTVDGQPYTATQWTQVSGPGTIAFTGSYGGAASCFVSTPGDYVLRCTTVGAVATVSADITVHIISPPQVFTSINAPQTAIVNLPITLDGKASNNPPGPNPITVSWQTIAGPFVASIVPYNAPQAQATFDRPGIFTLRMNASNGDVTTHTDVTVTVVENQAPVIMVPATIPVSFPDAAALNAVVTDDGLPSNTLSSNWTVVSGPGTVVFANAASASTTATFSATGAYHLRLTATDTLAVSTANVTVNVSATPNRPPVVDAGAAQTITLPIDSVTLNGTYTDDGLPNDPSIISVYWSTVSGPGGVGISNFQGKFSATFDTPGVYVLRMTVSDSLLSTSADTTITVLAQNKAPVVSAGANQIISAHASLSLNGSATDDGLPSLPGALAVNWSKLTGPGNAVFTAANSAATSVTFDTPGAYTLQLSASDSVLTSTATVNVIVTPAAVNKAPVVSAGPNQTLRLPQNSTALPGVATDDGLPNPPGALTVAWNKVSGPGSVVFGNSAAAATTVTFGSSGKYVLALSASDGVLSSSSTVSITVFDPITAAGPSVNIDSPADGTEVTKPADLLATVTCATPVNWVLEYALNTDEDNAANLHFVTFASGSGNLASAKAGTFDPTLLLNGTYQVRLTATDSSGQSSAAIISLVARKNMKVGNFAIAFNDLTVPVAGIPIQIVRSYDSRDTRTGDFGAGWQLAVRDVRLEKTLNLGKQWFENADFTGFLGAFSMQEGRPHKVTITFPDGKVYEFQGSLSPSQQQAGTITSGIYVFTPVAPTLGKLDVVGDNDILVNGAPDEENPTVAVTLNNLNGTTFNPTLFKLTTQEGAEFVIDQNKGLVSMTDLNGNTITFTDNGIISSTGKSIVFDRDAQGRIIKITDPAGAAMTYGYDASGNLISFTDRVGNTTGFTFDNTHKLISIIDPRGITPITNTYDADGRLTSNTDAFGKQISYIHDIPGRTETVTDRLGNSTVHTYDDDGNVLRTIDAEGGVTLMSYDSRDNMLSMTDALNRVIHYEYDQLDNKTAKINNLGERTEATFDGNRRILTMKDPLGRVTTNQYDFKENLLQTSDPMGFVTQYDYDYTSQHGQPIKMTDALNHVWQYTYDNDGNRLSSTDPQGNLSTIVYGNNNVVLSQSVTRSKPGGGLETLTTTHDYDAQNRPIKTTMPDGTFTTMTYNSIGKQDTSTDQLGRVTSHEYNDQGYHVKTNYPDGLFDASTYDAEGRRLTSIDRAGRTTTTTYDKVGRTTQVTYPDATVTSTTYDLSGQVTQSTDARGNVTKYEYDDVGRRSKVTDAINKVTQFTYDTNGNQKTIVDALNHVMTYDYDLNNRRTKTTFNDGTFTTTEYDSVGRRTAEVDQAGKRTEYGYDELGRLFQVKDALGQITRYAYNEIGQQIGQIDALNRITSYEYDQLGRRVKRTLPQGQFETYAYNSVGSLTSRVDFNNKTTGYSYDTLNRLTTKTPDASFNAPSVSYTYTATGQRATMVDGSGTTTYTYNSRDWLTSKQTPEGTLNYTYDVAGNLATVSTSHAGGAAMTYTYDTLNRPATATDNHVGGTTTYAYDDVGNLQSFSYPNGTSHTYTYDSLNRLTNLTGAKGNQTLAGYAYTLGASGNRTDVVEFGGRTLHYGYDAIYRLTGETISGVPLSGAISYIYDAVGNRQTRSSTVPSVASMSSTFSNNDWLNSDTYDNNGNTTQSDALTYTYDYENRITSASNGVQIVYDGDGNRVSKTFNGVTTQYLVDTNNLTGYAQVLEEINPGNQVVKVYSFGTELISQTVAGAGLSFYGFDGHGSVRYLTDLNGALTDTYTYDAFGILIGRTGATDNNFLYCGEQFDPQLGFYYLRARYMNPNTGRFWTMDGYEGGTVDPNSLHKYLFCHNDAVNYFDPSGNAEFTLLGVTVSLNIQSLVRGYLLVQNVLGFVNNARAFFLYSIEAIQAFTQGQFINGLGYSVAAVIHGGLAVLNVIGIQSAISSPPFTGGSLTLLQPAGSGGGVSYLIQITANNPPLKAWIIKELVPAILGSGLVVTPMSASQGVGFGGGGDGGSTGRNPAQDKMLTDSEIKRLAAGGYDPHDYKDLGARLDLYKDKYGNIYIKMKGGRGPGEPMGLNINDF